MALSSGTFEATGLDGIPLKIDINNDDSANVVRGANQFVVIEGGETGGVRLDPIWPKSARIFVVNEDLSGVFGKGERAVPVEIFSTDGGDTLEFFGYLVTDFYNDAPYLPDNIVELRALDGIGTLENDTFDEISSVSGSGSKITFTTAIGEILSSIHGASLNVDYGVHWYPSQISDSAKNPLNVLKFNTNNYREDRESFTEGDFRTQLEVLRDICKCWGLRLQQTRQDGELVWSLVQTGAIKESSTQGDLKIWRHDTTGSLVNSNNYPKTINVNKSLSNNAFEEGHSRELSRQRSSVKVVYDHRQVSNLIPEGTGVGKGISGFETQSSDWSLPSSGTGWDAGRVKHSNTGWSPTNTANDTYFGYFAWDASDANTGQNIQWGSRNLQSISKVGSAVNGSLSASVGAKTSDIEIESVIPPKIELSVGPNSDGDTFYLVDDKTKTRSAITKGQTEVTVEPISSAIPKGAKLPVFKPGQVPLVGSFKVYNGFFTLSERHEKDAEVLRGTFTNDVPKDSEIYFARWQSTQGLFNTKFFVPKVIDQGEYWTAIQNKFVWQGSSGEDLSGDVTIKLYNYMQDGDGPLVETGVDNIQIQLVKNGSVVNQSVSVGKVDQTGSSDTIKTLIGQGPSTNNRSRIRADTFEPSGWGSGAGGGSKPLEEFHVQERLRRFRDQNQRLFLTFMARDKTPRLRGSELIEFDGKLYRPSQISYDPSRGVVDVEMLQYKDYGTA